MSGLAPGGGRSSAIDALRGVAALSVLVFHVWLYTLPVPTAGAREAWSEYAVHELRLGLVLFFVLTGYLLIRPWIASRLDGKPAPSIRGYAVRRGARIAPAYYVALIASVILLWPHTDAPGVRLPPAEDLWLFGLFAQNFEGSTLMSLDPPMWTLSVEATYYLALPLLGLMLLRLPGRVGLLVLPALLIGAGIWWNASIAGAQAPDYASKILPAMLPYFGLGMAAAILAHGRRPSRRTALVLLLAGSAFVIGDGVWHALGAVDGSRDLKLRIWRDVPAAAGFAAIIVAAAHSARTPRLLRSRPLIGLGTISYGVYLWHVPVMVWLRAEGMLPSSPYLAFIVAFPLIVLIAMASWRWVEAPAISAARRVGRAPAPVTTLSRRQAADASERRAA